MKIIGLALIVIGILVGLYFGIWWAFIGGIIQGIEAIKAEDIVPLSLALAIARVVFAGVIGWATALIFVIPGIGIIK